MLINKNFLKIFDGKLLNYSIKFSIKKNKLKYLINLLMPNLAF